MEPEEVSGCGVEQHSGVKTPFCSQSRAPHGLPSLLPGWRRGALSALWPTEKPQTLLWLCSVTFDNRQKATSPDNGYAVWGSNVHKQALSHTSLQSQHHPAAARCAQWPPIPRGMWQSPLSLSSHPHANEAQCDEQKQEPARLRAATATTVSTWQSCSEIWLANVWGAEMRATMEIRDRSLGWMLLACFLWCMFSSPVLCNCKKRCLAGTLKRLETDICMSSSGSLSW